MLAQDNVINHSSTSVLHNNILNVVTIRATTDLSNSNILKHEYIMQLNDAVAMTMLQTKFIDNYIYYESDAGVFMSDLFFR